MIQAHGLTKHYGATRAVEDLSFDVQPGRVTGFLGPNGSGKSTTMRMILGLDRPDKGEVLINGRLYRSHWAPLFEVGALLDAHAVHPGRSAFHHLLALAQSNRISKRRVNDVLDMVGLTSVAGKRVGGFSLGMHQRLGIAGALLGDPDTLLFDEPINGLDPVGIRWVRDLLKELAADGRTVFVSSHLMSEMALTADYLVVIGRGRLIAETSMADFIARSSQNYIRVRAPQAEQLAKLLIDEKASVTRQPDGADGVLAVSGIDMSAVGDIAARHQLVLHELSPQAASLEEAFMEMTGDSVDYKAPVVSRGE